MAVSIAAKAKKRSSAMIAGVKRVVIRLNRTLYFVGFLLLVTLVLVLAR